MATPQQGGTPQQKAAVSSAKNILAGANKFEKSVDPQGVNAPKPPAASASNAVKAKTPMTPEQNSGSVENQNRKAAAEEGAKYGMHGMPIMHDGGVVKEDGPHMLQKGETVIPASGRQSHYRDVFEERGRKGLHAYGHKGEKNTATPNKD